MQTLTYHFVDKSGWGPGPWSDEPDKIQWADEDTGLPCLIVRNRAGALCGYVGIPESHPWFGMDYDAINPDVHGGLTYSGFGSELWWLGFDCAHLWDVMPRMQYLTQDEGVYRDMAFVKGECHHLALQIAAAGEQPCAG